MSPSAVDFTRFISAAHSLKKLGARHPTLYKFIIYMYIGLIYFFVAWYIMCGLLSLQATAADVSEKTFLFIDLLVLLLISIIFFLMDVIVIFYYSVR